MITRRSIIFGLIAAPVVVRMGLIMTVRAATQRDLIDWIVWNRTHRNWQWGYADRMPAVFVEGDRNWHERPGARA